MRLSNNDIVIEIESMFDDEDLIFIDRLEIVNTLLNNLLNQNK